MTDVQARRGCKQCGTWYIHDFFVVVASNGSRQIRGRCVRCGEESENIRHDALRFLGIDPSQVPVARDYGETHPTRPCVVCGSRYAELHHWAPDSVFKDEADRFPVDWLCVSCHQEWHRRMNGYRWGAA